MKKPPIPSPRDPQFGESIRDALQTILGRRDNKIAPLYPILRPVSATPTQAEMMAIARDVAELQSKINELLETLQG